MTSSSLKHKLITSVSFIILGIGTPAFAADLDAPAEKEFVEVGSFRGSILLPGTGISFKVGGYTKGDVFFTFDDFSPGSGNGAFGETVFEPSTFGGTGGDRTRFSALQSRLNFDARTTTELGAARAFLELDLFNTSGNENSTNSANPRLRHAFAELGIEKLNGSLLVGQTWTNFGDLGSFANTLDFNGPNAQVFVRQAQVRWTQNLNDTFTLSFSAENPEFNGNVSGADNGLDAVPDFTAAIKAKTDYGNFSLSGLGRYLDVDNSANPNLTSDTTFAYGVQFAGTVNVGQRDKFRFQVAYGDGIGRYLQLGPQAAVLTANGSLEAVEAFATNASYQHFWSEKLQSNLVGGYITVDEIGDAAGNEVGLEANEIYAALNLIYSPRSNISLGVEGLYGRSEVDNAAGGDDDVDGFRLQTSLQFSF